MSTTPVPPRRDWTAPIIVGAIGLAVLLVVCIAGSAAAFLAFRGKSDTTTNATPSPSSAPSRPAPPPASQSPTECLIGDWIEVSYVGTSEIYGVNVQLSSKGTLMRFGADGKMAMVLENIVLTGSAQGSQYEVIHNGTLALNFVADATTINYSSPQATGTTTWKVDGKVQDTEPLRASLKPETYRCSGNDLRIFGEQSASELKRILPPGTPV